MSRPESPIWRPYTQQRTASVPLELVSADGAFLQTRSGARLLDGISSWWLITHGHCHPRLVEAIRRQAGRLDQVTFASFTHEPAEELAEQLLRVTPPELTRVFFSDNGSTAVEVALKMALQACAQTGRPEKTRFLAFEGAYHGDTVGAMSVSADSAFNRPYRPALFDVVRAAQPTDSRAPLEEWTRDVRRRLEEDHRTLAGVIIEPLVQGAGGMIMWPREAVREIADLCGEFDVYLIFDEVMTGFGRTGSMFAMDAVGIAPDMVCLSKGLTGGTLPLAVTLASERVYEAFLSSEKSRLFFHGHSFTGNPLSCAAAVASLSLFREENTLGAIEMISRVHRREIEAMAAVVPVSDPRVCGSIAAFEAGRESDRSDYLGHDLSSVVRRALDQGLFLRSLGRTLYLMPPYCATERQLSEAWGVLRSVLSGS